MMEKKSLGRGLVDISRMFMTPEEELNPDESSPIFLSTPVREESCSSCLNVIEQSPAPLKCRIFSFKNEKYGGLILDSILPGYAKYCRYFESPAVFKNENDPVIKSTDSDAMQHSIEIEETINRQKNIAIKDDKDLQDNINKILSQHLEKGYQIVRIELEKIEEQTDGACRLKRNEKVAIFKKETILSS